MVPLRARVLLAHARIAALAADIGLQALHVKGYAALPGAYDSHRTSTDVDVLTQPAEARRLLDALQSEGWELVTDFAHGSIFEHAATLRHVQLGYVDVHRHFPGIGLPAQEAFDLLWRDHGVRVRAGHPLPVPCLVHQRLLVLIHASRDPSRRRSDMDALLRLTDHDGWEAMRRAAREFHAEAAWEAATDEPLGDDPDRVALYRAMSGGARDADLFALRWKTTKNVRDKAALVLKTLPVNRAHLSMGMDREATHWDALKWQAKRVGQASSWIRRRLDERRRGRRTP